jgi:hypothetical protein
MNPIPASAAAADDRLDATHISELPTRAKGPQSAAGIKRDGVASAQQIQRGTPLVRSAPAFRPRAISAAFIRSGRPVGVEAVEKVSVNWLSLSRRIAFYKCVALVDGTNIVRRELGLPEARVRAADPKLWFAGREHGQT